jgi:hydroxyacylglutathione hydrolase
LGYIPGSINSPLAKSLTDWAGWLLAYDQPIYLIASQEASVLEACTALRSIGLDLVAGWFGADALSAYGSRFPLEKITVAGFERLDDDVTILDVRGRGEVAAGAIPGSINIHLGHLQNRSADIPKDKPIVVHCQAGGRSPIAVTVLRKLGFKNVEDFKPGYGGWKAAQVSVEA